MAARYWFINNNQPRLQRIIRRRDKNPLHLPDAELLKEYRMPCQQIFNICDLVRTELGTRGYRSVDLTLEEKVLLSLKTLASGSFQNSSKDYLDVAQPTVSTVLNDFVNAIVPKASDHIYMPRTRSELEATKSSFYDVARFPGVLGLVDGTHIPIIAPPEDEYAYINRKNFHSINVQGICNAEMIFTDVNAQWPGGHHDSFILNESTIHDNFERGDYGEGWLLGDSGYGLKRWLMTPIATPVTNQQRKYNLSHRKTRCPIERSFGALKSRWRIIDHSGGRLCYLPEKVAKITSLVAFFTTYAREQESHYCTIWTSVPLLHDPFLEENFFMEQLPHLLVQDWSREAVLCLHLFN